MTETHDTNLLLRAFVDELVRCGLSAICTSPGSRNAPLLLALARDGRVPCWPHVDERVSGFFAVGAAKAAGLPAVLACTSGTAATQYLPAVTEAHEARVPLIVLTADRPPELRDTGAGQAIDQLRLFGVAAKWFFDIGSHEATPERLRWMRRLACRAHAVATTGRPGVVHLNLALREPLVSEEALGDEPGGGGRPDGRPWVTVRAAAPTAVELELPTRTVIVAGRDERPGDLGGAVAEAAERLGAPLLADPLSGARHGPAAIAHYDALLRSEAFAAAHAPAAVVRIGDLPTSKPLRAWLASLDARQIAFDPEEAWQDPDAVVAELLHADPRAWADDTEGMGPGDWLHTWRAADAAAAGAIDVTLGEELSEPAVAHALGSLAPQTTVFIASSMPIRDAETFWPVPAGATARGPRALAHRGANGIDGTIAAAYGAAATGAHVVVHIGDVALAHDLSALACGQRLGLQLTVVVVDNDGGGIFDFLPLATQTDVFERHVATPTGLDVERTAGLFGLPYVPVHTVPGLLDAVTRPGLVHVRTDRAQNVELHRHVWRAVSAALG